MILVSYLFLFCEYACEKGLGFRAEVEKRGLGNCEFFLELTVFTQPLSLNKIQGVATSKRFLRETGKSKIFTPIILFLLDLRSLRFCFQHLLTFIVMTIEHEYFLLEYDTIYRFHLSLW